MARNRDTTVDELLSILEIDLVEKRELLEQEKLLNPENFLESKEKVLY